MSDLISRQKALDGLKYEMKYGAEIDICGLDTAYDIIENIQSAEPERKKGTWEVQPSTGDDRPFIWWKCSVCGHVIFSETERDRREFHAFCGRCGAEMARK